MKIKQILYMFGFATMALIGAFFASPVQAQYIYEADQDLYDLTGHSGTTNLGVGDDSISAQFNFGFDFEYYGNTFTFARMATNGCLHLGLTSTNGANYCADYHPDPLPQYSNTLFPFWTDLIRDSGSKMLAKNILDSNNNDLYTIFGWYNLREYNQNNTDNSIEVWLYPNDTFEFRYGGLDIDNHDVLIGEQGPTTSDIYTYIFFDECNTGSTNSSTCTSYDWNNSQNTTNTLLEDGGSLYGLGSGNAIDCSNPLNNASCAGYAAAYLAQQCGIDSLYSTSCPLYWEAYDDQQCDDDPQYAPFCAGYTQEASVAYFDTETDYGYDDYTDDQYGYDEEYEEYEDMYAADNCYDDPSYCYDDDPYAGIEFTDEEWYAIDLEEFGQEIVDELYGAAVAFTEDGHIEWDSSELETWEDLEEQMDQYDEIFAYEDYEEEIFVEELFYDEYERTSDTIFYEEDYLETDYTYAEHDFIEIFDAEEILEEFEFLTVIAEEFVEYEEIQEWEEFETIEELEEWFQEEAEEFIEEYEEEYYAEEETFEEELYAEEVFEEEAVEEIYEELEELEEIELLAEETIEEPAENLEVELVASNEPSSSGIRSEQLNVVADSVRAATNSVSGTTSGVSSTSGVYGSSSQTTGNTVASGGVASAATGGAASGVSSAGVSTTSSPSISDQFASASAQTQQVLAMSPSTAVSSDLSSAGTGLTSSGDSSSSAESITAAETTASSDATASVSAGESVASTSSESSSTEVTITPMPGMTGGQQVAMVDVQVADLSSEIDTASTGVMTASEADQNADENIANNIEEQQQQVAASAEESGEYGDQSALVAFIGFNPSFTGYYDKTLPQRTDWYEPREIYADARISDNISAFYDMAGTSLRTIQGMINSQPNLLGE